MYSLFNFIPSHSNGLAVDPLWMYLKPNLQRNVDTVVDYYRRSPFAVKSQHFLVRLLHAITVPKSQEITRYYDNVQGCALGVAQTLGMTSAISKGHLFDGVFYGTGNKEILIATDIEFDPVEADENWKNLAPIRVLRHPRSDLNFNIPNGINSGIEDGIVVVSINIPLLAIQYRGFRLEEYKKSLSGENSQKSMIQFLHMYPLTNMVPSHADYCLFNRVVKLYENRPLGCSKVKHPFYLIDYHKELNKFQRMTLENLLKSSKGFYDTLRSIPAISETNMVDVLKLPAIAKTRQVTWALTISRLPALDFLFSMAKVTGTAKNKTEINAVLRRLKEQRSDNLMRSMLSEDISLLMDIERELIELTESA